MLCTYTSSFNLCLTLPPDETLLEYLIYFLLSFQNYFSFVWQEALFVNTVEMVMMLYILLKLNDVVSVQVNSLINIRNIKKFYINDFLLWRLRNE